MIWDVPPFCIAAQPVLPNSHQPMQNRADSGTVQIQVNPIQVRQEMGHPVLINMKRAVSKNIFVSPQQCPNFLFIPTIHQATLQSISHRALRERGVWHQRGDPPRRGQRHVHLHMPRHRDRGDTYTTSAKISHFVPLPPCHLQKSADFVTFVCFLGTPFQ